jgi:hypothetical protein
MISTSGDGRRRWLFITQVQAQVQCKVGHEHSWKKQECSNPSPWSEMYDFAAALPMKYPALLFHHKLLVPSELVCVWFLSCTRQRTHLASTRWPRPKDFWTPQRAADIFACLSHYFSSLVDLKQMQSKSQTSSPGQGFSIPTLLTFGTK